MLFDYVRQFRHDRRRILFASALTLAAGAIAGQRVPDPFAVPTEALLVCAFLVAIPLFTARFRARRHWIEIIALVNLVVAIAGSVAPEGLFGWHDPIHALTLQAPAYLGLVLGLKTLIYGAWSDAWAPRNRYTVSTTVTTPLALHDLWYGMVPTPGFIDHNPDPEVVAIDFADTSKRRVRLTTWVPPRVGAGEVLLEFDEIAPLRFVRFRLSVIKGMHDPTAEGLTEMTFIDRGPVRQVKVRHRVKAFTPRRALLAFFDDTIGRMISTRIAAIETRVATGRPTKSATGVNGWFLENGVVGTVRRGGSGGAYQTAYDRPYSAEETRVLETLGRL